MRKLAHLFFLLALHLLVFYSAQAQTVGITTQQEQKLIPGQIVVYFQNDITPEKAKQSLLELNLEILKTDIKPVTTFLSNPNKTMINEIEKHSSIETYHIHTVVFDSTTLRELKFT